METKTLGFVRGKNLRKAVFAAEAEDDKQIKLEGLKVGRTYHIRPLFNLKRKCYLSPLPTGDYKITEFTLGAFVMASVIHFVKGSLGPFTGMYFQVEGDENWYQFDYRLVFSHVESEV